MNSRFKVRHCTVCKQEITNLGRDGVPVYYRVIEKIYNWYCGSPCATEHHQMGYKPIEDEPTEEKEDEQKDG